MKRLMLDTCAVIDMLVDPDALGASPFGCMTIFFSKHLAVWKRLFNFAP